MRTAGIICECNPLHAGHRYLIDQVRQSGADAVVCVMSGCFTQRGEPAVLPPRCRAEMLLQAGADVVLELPFPYAAAGAEQFAEAGIRILSRLGVGALWFGSECGDVELLRRAAQVASGDDFARMYRERCTEGSRGTAAAYFDCLREQGGDEMRFYPNDILGIAYLRILERLHSHIRPVTVRRTGSGFHEEGEPQEGDFPSATALRRLMFHGGADALAPWMPQEQLKLVRREMANGTAPARLELAERALLGSLRLMPPERLEQTPELTGGLGRRVRAAAYRAGNLAELLAFSATKKYPESRIRRGIHGQKAPGLQPRLINAHPVKKAVRPREIDVFKYTAGMPFFRKAEAGIGFDPLFRGNRHDLSRQDVPDILRSHRIQGAGL